MSKMKLLDDLSIEELKHIQDYLANEFAIVTAKIMGKETEEAIRANAAKDLVKRVEKRAAWVRYHTCRFTLAIGSRT